MLGLGGGMCCDVLIFVRYIGVVEGGTKRGS